MEYAAKRRELEKTLKAKREAEDVGDSGVLDGLREIADTENSGQVGVTGPSVPHTPLKATLLSPLAINEKRNSTSSMQSNRSFMEKKADLDNKVRGQFTNLLLGKNQFGSKKQSHATNKSGLS